MHAIGLQMEKVETQPSLVVSKPLEIHVPGNRPGSTKGFPFEFELGSRLVRNMGSFVEGSKNLKT
jgi:hypothetical protein